MRVITYLCLLSAVLVSTGLAGRDASPLPAGARIYIEPMEWQMEQHLAREIQRQAVPVHLVANPEEADYVLNGFAEKLSSHFLSPGRCFQVKIETADHSRTIWTGEADDYAMVFGRLPADLRTPGGS